MKMLFDPAKKQLHAPARAIQVGDGECGEQEVVGQKNQPQIFLGIEVMDALQGGGIARRVLLRVKQAWSPPGAMFLGGLGR